MEVARIYAKTRTVGLDQSFVPLPIRDEVVDGVPIMFAAFLPSADDLERLNRGESLLLGIQGTMWPPVLLKVGDHAPIPDAGS